MSSLLLWGGSSAQQFLGPPYDRNWQPFENSVLEQLEQTGAVPNALSLLHNLLAALMSSSYPTAVAKNISQQCLLDSQEYVHSLYVNTSLWALQSKSSSTKKSLLLYDIMIHTVELIELNQM